MIYLNEIIQQINPIKVIGKTDCYISEPIQLTPLNQDASKLMWASEKYYSVLKKIEIGVVICQRIEDSDVKDSVTYLIVDNARDAFRIVLETFYAEKTPNKIADSAHIAANVELGQNIYIGENVIIEKGCKVGDNTQIDHNTVIKRNSIIGKFVKIGANTVIGGVGFGYEKAENGAYKRIPHIGKVIIEDNVEIGNCTTIDRAVMGSTIVGKNTKIDNLVHIAHGVKIGENSLVIAHAMIAGSVEIGKNVWVAPASSILNKVTIADNATIGMGAVVLKSVDEGQVIIGNPGRVLKKN